MLKKERWLRIKNYHFENLVSPNIWQQLSELFDGHDASVKAFASKIARKHKWHNRFALGAIGEYKKFVYLGIISDFQVTPSKVIDTVWHEHVLFSKAYREFCEEVIQYPFDHHPELMPNEAMTGIFYAQYLDTIELYKKEFGIDPPEQVWAIPKFETDPSLPLLYKSQKKKEYAGTGDSIFIYDSIPLVTYFDTEMQIQESVDFPEFNAGDFGGGGAGDSWGSDGSDASSSDSSGSDSNGSDSSCSSCSSGCGGGGD